MIYRVLILMCSISGCSDITNAKIDEHLPPKDELYKEHVSQLHENNLSEIHRNQNIINILSVKHSIPDSLCNKILIDYLDMVNNHNRDYSTDYKLEAIKNYALENDITEEQVGSLLYDYVTNKNLN